MCHRYSLISLSAVAALHAELAEAIEGWQPRYNVALTQAMPVVVRRDGRPALERLHFGFLLPPRAGGARPLLVGNARAETLRSRPAFREALQHRRCLVPADGFFEWEKQGTRRLPHYFALPDRQPFFFAGLWTPATTDAPAAFVIVTTTANARIAAIHDRMPVMLGPNSGPHWLGDTPLPEGRIAQLCRPLPAEKLAGHRVDPRMNNVRYEAADAIAPV
jgi:putative SOS response-associated peptidase YedK